MHLHLAGGRLEPPELLGAQGRLQPIDHFAGPVRFEDLHLVRAIGVTDVGADGKAIELVFGERIRAFVLVRVLRRQHEERRFEHVGPPFDRHLAFVHRLQQGALRAGGGAVDFVGQQNVREDRPATKLEVPQIGQVDTRAQDVAGQHVGRELQPRELAVETLRDGLGQQGLADARRIFDQEVAFRQQRNDR